MLYECLAGRQAFAGETVSDMIALILQGEPDWSALPASLPPRLRDLIARCLVKDVTRARASDDLTIVLNWRSELDRRESPPESSTDTRALDIGGHACRARRVDPAGGRSD